VIKAILFDRDCTLIHNVPYNGDPTLVRPIDGVTEFLAGARQAGLLLGVVTTSLASPAASSIESRSMLSTSKSNANSGLSTPGRFGPTRTSTAARAGNRCRASFSRQPCRSSSVQASA